VERTVRLTEIVVVGSVNLDLVVTAPTLPQPGETVLGGDLRTVPGGKGANQAVAAARAGARCAFIGAVGQDAFAQPLRDNLAAAGVALRGLRTVPGPSGVALITVDAAAENSIVVAPGANAQLSGLDAEDRAAIAAADVLLCQLEIPLTTVRQAAIVARAAGTMVVLNAAPARALPAELLDAVDILVVNEVEAAAVAAAGWSTDVLTALLAVVPRVVLTLGARGAAYADRDGTRLDVDAPRIDAVDTTAAGDAFAGAFVVALAERRPVAEALRWACAAGAACARRPGASSALPTRDDIDDLFATTYRATP
jgi:ribokinase